MIKSQKDYPFTVDEILYQSNCKPTVLMFLADWSGSSYILEEIMLRLMPKHTDIQFIPIEQHETLFRYFNITCLPTLLFLQDSEVLDCLQGLQPKKVIQRFLENNHSYQKAA